MDPNNPQPGIKYIELETQPVHTETVAAPAQGCGIFHFKVRSVKSIIIIVNLIDNLSQEYTYLLVINHYIPRLILHYRQHNGVIEDLHYDNPLVNANIYYGFWLKWEPNTNNGGETQTLSFGRECESTSLLTREIPTNPITTINISSLRNASWIISG